LSTKIYEGFSLPNLPATKLIETMNGLREKAHDVAISLYVEQVTRQALRLLDIVSVQGVDALTKHLMYWFDDDKSTNDEIATQVSLYIDEYSILSIAMAIVRDDAHRSEMRQERSTNDFGFSISLLQGPGKLLGIPYAQHKEFKKLLEELPGYKEYGYWNNTDAPDGMCARTWGSRKKAWDSALSKVKSGSSVPALNGMTFELAISSNIYNNYHGVFTYTLPEMDEDGRYRELHEKCVRVMNSVISSQENRRAGLVGRLIGDALEGRFVCDFSKKYSHFVAGMDTSIHNILRAAAVINVLRYVIMEPTKDHEYVNMKLSQSECPHQFTSETLAQYREDAKEMYSMLDGKYIDDVSLDILRKKAVDFT
jgi:hypothetical protein